ncbi:unnamed protein product [Ectocarpus sp. 8 AP-2014]
MCDVLPEKKVSLWAARSRERCVGQFQTETEVDQHLGPVTPVIPERAQAEALNAEKLEKYINTNSRALVELAKLEEEKAKQAKVAAAGGEQEDPALLARIGVVKDGIYKRMKLLASWADLDDDQVCR